MSPDDWAVVADRLLIEGHPRAEILAVGLRRAPAEIAPMTRAADLAPVLPPGDWPWVLLAPPLTRSMTLELYGLVRPKVERESRRVLPVSGSLTALTRTLRRKPRHPPRMRRLQRSAGHHANRGDRLTTLARMIDPLMPERWRWSALAHLIAGDPALIQQVTAALRRWADIESIVQLIHADTRED